jgi:TPR repeat protein
MMAFGCVIIASETVVNSIIIEGITNYNFCLLYGIDVPMNKSEGARYFKLAADQNDKYGHYFSGLTLLNGWAIATDYDEAMKFFRLAAERSLAEAQVAAGVCSFYAIGCCADLTEAED